jgi:FRG domain
MQAKAELGNPEILWYRGHPNSNFYLLASLLRYKNGIDKEKHLFTGFKKFSDRILKRRDSEWETLFEMQHYGVPTRLLDWSETFGVALFFAATYNQSRHPNQDAALYLLDPVALNQISGLNKIFLVPRDEANFGYTRIY